MIRFLATRSLGALVTLLVKSFVIFALIGLMPGDPIDMLTQANPDATPEDVAKLRAIYGVDQPIGARWWTWLIQALQGDFGYSRAQHRPVLEIILPALGNTLILMGLAFVISTIIAVFLGFNSSEIMEVGVCNHEHERTFCRRVDSVVEVLN